MTDLQYIDKYIHIVDCLSDSNSCIVEFLGYNSFNIKIRSRKGEKIYIEDVDISFFKERVQLIFKNSNTK